MAADGAELPDPLPGSGWCSSCKALPERDGAPLLDLWLLGTRGSGTCTHGRVLGAPGSPVGRGVLKQCLLSSSHALEKMVAVWVKELDGDYEEGKSLPTPTTLWWPTAPLQGAPAFLPPVHLAQEDCAF